MGLMILAILIGAAASASSLFLGASLWVAFGLYALTGAGFILIAACAIFLGGRDMSADNRHKNKVHG